MGIETALGIGSVIGGVSNLLGANKSANATKDASKQATALQREQFLQGLEQVRPFKEAGQSALPNLTAAANEAVSPFQYTDPTKFLTDYFNSPEFNTLNTQATDQILRNRSVTGGLRSGGANADLAKIAPMLGLDALQRRNQQDVTAYGLNQSAIGDRFNRLYGLVNMGANVASGNQSAGMQFGSQAGANAINAGNAKAQAYSSMGSTLGGLATDAASIYAGNKMGLFGSPPPANPATSNMYTGEAYKNWVASQGGKL